MSGRTAPDLRQHLLRLHIGLLLAMENAVSAAQALRDHVCDPAGPDCDLCHLADVLATANRLGRLYDRVELHAGPLVDGAELDAAFVRVRELLGQLPPAYLANLLGRPQTPQRASNN